MNIIKQLFLLFFLSLIFSCKPNCDSNCEGMVYFKGGEITIGSSTGFANEYPPFEINVKPFYIDKHQVTVKEFRKFVNETGFKTDADKFGDAGVYNYDEMTWELVKGANWEYPMGRAFPMAKDNHPVTQVSWQDANAYAKWAGKRLPSEIEWEYAARNGENTSNKYSWGNTIYENGKFKTNVWQGSFPEYNDTLDGFLQTSPVGYFGTLPNGLMDMGGNVWEWCADTYELYNGNSQFYEKDDKVKVIRGGSFMCDSNVCHGYRVSSRTYCSSETSLFHQGFRCAADCF